MGGLNNDCHFWTKDRDRSCRFLTCKKVIVKNWIDNKIVLLKNFCSFKKFLDRHFGENAVKLFLG